MRKPMVLYLHKGSVGLMVTDDRNVHTHSLLAHPFMLTQGEKEPMYFFFDFLLYRLRLTPIKSIQYTNNL